MLLDDGKDRIVSCHQSSSVTLSSGIPDEVNHCFRPAGQQNEHVMRKLMLTETDKEVDCPLVVFPKVHNRVIVKMVV